MIFLCFKKRRVRESDKKRYARIIAREIPHLIRFNRAIRSANKEIDIEKRLIFK